MARTGPRTVKTPFAPTKRYRFSISVSKDPVLHAFLEIESVEKMLELFRQHLIDSEHPCANPETLKELIYQATIQGGVKAPVKKVEAIKPVKTAPVEKVREQPAKVIKQVVPKVPLERPTPAPTPPVYEEPAEQELDVYQEPEVIVPPAIAPVAAQPIRKEEVSAAEREALKSIDVLVNSQGNIEKQRKIWTNDEA